MEFHRRGIERRISLDAFEVAEFFPVGDGVVEGLDLKGGGVEVVVDDGWGERAFGEATLF